MRPQFTDPALLGCLRGRCVLRRGKGKADLEGKRGMVGVEMMRRYTPLVR